MRALERLAVGIGVNFEFPKLGESQVVELISSDKLLNNIVLTFCLINC